MEKVRLTDKYYDLFHSETIPHIIHIPTSNYITIRGKGELFNNPIYDQSYSLLQGIAFFIKFSLKQDPPSGFFDYRLTPSEIIRSNTEAPKTQQKRKIMLFQPDFVSKEHVEKAYLTAKQKQEKNLNITLPSVSFQQVKAGKYIQILHDQKYTTQKRSINRLHSYAEKNGYILSGQQHEIFLKDPRKHINLPGEIIIRRPIKKKK